MSPKYSNPNRRLKPPSEMGRTISLILTIVLLCIVFAVAKECLVGGHEFAPATQQRPSKH